VVHAVSDVRSGDRRLRIGMVGGGREAFIGAVHRMAIRLDDQASVVAGALSSDAEVAALSAADIGIAPDRAYASYEQMALAEATRSDGVEAVVIVTPNHLHAPVARASGLVFAVSLNNTGYAMVRQAREMVAAGAIGDIRIIRVEYVQDWLTLPIDAEGQKQAAWRTDPKRAGRSACLADIGVHAHSLAAYVTGLTLESVCADLSTFVPGRALDDNAHVLLRYAGGARGVLVASQVSPGNYNRLSLQVYGSSGGIEWCGEEPDVLLYCELGKPKQRLVRGGPGATEQARRSSRLPAAHPEGYIEGFANFYRDAIELIRARRSGTAPDPAAHRAVPTVEDGARGLKFVESAVESHLAGGVWVPAVL
jgi:predicted dehydrogenase